MVLLYNLFIIKVVSITKKYSKMLFLINYFNSLSIFWICYSVKRFFIFLKHSFDLSRAASSGKFKFKVPSVLVQALIEMDSGIKGPKGSVILV